ncbi:hypothetical protein [Halovivax ruber]|nr:hypothetical protein [Halovivax ruber]
MDLGPATILDHDFENDDGIAAAAKLVSQPPRSLRDTSVARR